jgi:DNA (cytosine-5)-methyltransferase 1
MRYLSLFSGIEAASVAWHPLGWTPVAFAEVEPFPSAVLEERFPDVPNLGDVTKFKEWPDVCVCPAGESDRSGGEERSAGSGVEQGTELHSQLYGLSRNSFCGECGGIYAPDIIVGGSPCQSFSVAGLRKGLDDPRGNLALTYLAIVEKYRPKWFLWENVPGVLSSNRGRDFGSFLGAVAQLGYGFAYRVLDAQYVRTPEFPHAVPQRRRRVFVVGCLGDEGRASAVLFDSESLSGNPPPRREKRKEVAADAEGGVGSDRRCFQQNTRDEVRYINRDGKIAGALAAEAGMKQQNYIAYENHPTDSRIKELDGTSPTVVSRWGTGGNNQPLVQNPMQVRRLTPVECERLQGFPDDWTRIPWRKKSLEDCPDGPRYKAIGNSMAVNVMQWIGMRIAMMEEIDAENS